ncbi:MAG: alpha/beta hydrolase [Clostridia bacterium]|nr:alpha/beta hydrolase [Clostridia bacterium]
MAFKPFPGYEQQLETYRAIAHGTAEEKKAALRAQRKALLAPEVTGVTFEDLYIDGLEAGHIMQLRVCRPEGVKGPLPLVLDIHGGGWTAGAPETDDYRNSLLAKGIPAVVVSPDYRLAKDGVHYPDPLNDCLTALQWLVKHAEEMGIDPARIGLYGTSAGGNIAAGLLFYMHEHGGPEISVAALLNPTLKLGSSPSRVRNKDFALDSENWALAKAHAYLGDLDREHPPVAAFPGHAEDVSFLPTVILVGSEYCPLVDDVVDFAKKLLDAGVHCELILTPGTAHGYCATPGPMTQWTMDGICLTMKREFGLL